MDIAKQIKDRRKALEISQAALAALTGVPQSRISEYERGARVPSVGTLLALSTVLGQFTIGSTLGCDPNT